MTCTDVDAKVLKLCQLRLPEASCMVVEPESDVSPHGPHAPELYVLWTLLYSLGEKHFAVTGSPSFMRGGFAGSRLGGKATHVLFQPVLGLHGAWSPTASRTESMGSLCSADAEPVTVPHSRGPGARPNQPSDLTLHAAIYLQKTF